MSADFLTVLLILAILPPIPTPGSKLIVSNPSPRAKLPRSPKSKPSRLTSAPNWARVDPYPKAPATGLPPVGIAAINDAILNSEISSKASIPFWIMAVGAFGIVVGLILYGPKLIRTVGSEITELDQIRAFSIAIAAALTVIIASQLGLPVSSTHIAVGGVFGVGFLREFLDANETRFAQEVRKKFKKDKKELSDLYNELVVFEAIEEKSKEDYIKIVDLYKKVDEKENIVRIDKKNFKDAKRTKYVKREAVSKIVAAWIITVPAAAILSAAIFFMIKGIMIP